MTDDVERLLGQVRRFQRQARRVAFARALGVTAGLAFAVAAVWTLTARTEPSLQAFVLGMAALSAILAAALVAWLRTPSLQQTGSAIDGSLKLEDRMVAALQLYRAPDVIAGLVISDAVRKLHGTSPEHVFPMRVGWWAAPALAGAGLVVVAMALDPASPLTTSSPNGAGGSGSATRAAQAGPAFAPDGASAGNQVVPDPASAGKPAAPDGARASAPPASADKPPRTDEASARKPTGADEASAGSPLAPAAPAPVAPAPVAPSRTQSHPVAPGAAVDGSRAAGGADSPATPRAGGVGGAPTSARTIEPLGRSPRSAMSAPAVAAARAQAEAAIGRGEIPPGFRKYVRDYFTAIQRSPPAK